jgi:hypothetical protein
MFNLNYSYVLQYKNFIYFLLGYYINLLINQILKNYINDKRPYKYPLKNRMPSEHSQAIFYVFGFLYAKNRYFINNIFVIHSKYNIYNIIIIIRLIK